MYIIFCHFSKVFHSRNALGPAFVQTSDSIVEELLILLFQSAICHADNVFPSELSLHMRGSGPHLTHSFLDPLESTPHHKWHLNRFSCFCKAHDCDRPTDRQTDRQTHHACNNRPHLHSSEMRRNNKLCNIVLTDGTNKSE